MLKAIKKDLMTCGYRPFKKDDLEIKFIDWLDRHFYEAYPFGKRRNLKDVIWDDYEPSGDYEELRSDNSCNWSGLVTFHIMVFRYKDTTYTGIAFHRGGDVRCNYTKYACFEMSFDEFFEEILQFQIEIPCENENWRILTDLISESGWVRAWNQETEEEFDGYYGNKNCPKEVQEACEKFF